MDNTFKFICNEGLYCNDKFVSLFEPVLDKKIYQYDEEEKTRTVKYCIYIRKQDGTISESKEVDSLKDIPYFNLWGCPDSLISNKQKKMLEFKLQKELPV